MGTNVMRWRIAVAVLATLLVATVAVVVGVTVFGSLSSGGGDTKVLAPETARDVVSTEGGGGALEVDNLVRSAALSVQVEDVAAAVEEIRTAAGTAGGFIQSSDLFSDSGWARADTEPSAAEPTALTGGYLLVRVRDTNLESFTAAIRDVGRVTAESVSTQDVTAQYTDLDARIPILEAERASLTEMLSRATTVEEELLIRDRLVAVSAELRSLLDQRALLADQDTMATVSIALSVPASARPPSSVDIPWFSWYELQLAFASGVAGFQRVVYGLLTAVIATAPIWIPLGIVLAVRRRRSRSADGVSAATEEPHTAESGAEPPGQP